MSSSGIQTRSPFQGLIPYGEADASFFFGREKETRLITANLFASPLTLLYGASGVGKSSVLRAGVAHQLRQRDDLLVVVFSAWQSNPASDLKQAIANQAKLADRAAWAKAVRLLPQDRPPSLVELLAICSGQLNRRLMIILDQFEEYFLYHSQDDEFAVEFPRVVTQSEVPVSFLISIREDLLAKLDRFEGRIPNLFDNYLRIEHLSYDSARDAIVKPVGRYNELDAGLEPVSIEGELVNAVLEQVQTGQVILGVSGRGVIKAESDESQIETPFLQMVMIRLWDEEMRAGSRVLRLNTLNSLGGAERIVRTHLDTTMGELSTDETDIAAEVFHYLVTPSGTKIAHTVPDLAEYAEMSRQRLAPVMERLASGEMRVLRGVAPPADQPTEPRYEIFHDVLAAAILDWRTRYVQTQEQSRSEQELMVAAEERAKAERQLARERLLARKLRLALVGLALLLAMMMAVTGWAFKQKREATDQGNAAKAAKKEADQQRDRAEQATFRAIEDRDRADSLRIFADGLRVAADNALKRAEDSARRAEEQKGLAIATERKAHRRAEIEAWTRQGLTKTRAGTTSITEGIEFLERANEGYKELDVPSAQVFALSSIAEAYAYGILGGISPFGLAEQVLDSEDPGPGQEGKKNSGLTVELAVAGANDPEEVKKTVALAVQYYERAMKIDYVDKEDSNSRERNKAAILKRIGDVEFCLALVALSKDGLQSEEEKVGERKMLRKIVNYYKKSAEAYRPLKEGSSDEADVLRLAGQLSYALLTDNATSGGDDADRILRTELDEVVDDYVRAAKIYEGRNPLKAALMLFKVGEVYRDFPEIAGSQKERAITSYKRAAGPF